MLMYVRIAVFSVLNRVSNVCMYVCIARPLSWYVCSCCNVHVYERKVASRSKCSIDASQQLVNVYFLVPPHNTYIHTYIFIV